MKTNYSKLLLSISAASRYHSVVYPLGQTTKARATLAIKRSES